MNRIIIENKLLEYLKLKGIKITKRGPTLLIDCVFCKAEQLCIKIPNVNKFNCHACKKNYDIFDLAKKLENKFPSKEIEQIHYLKELLKIEMVTKIDEDNTEKLLKFYEENNFDLVAIAKNQKIPIETAWTTKNHKDIDEWRRWLADGLNIGVKTGKMSGVTILDVDQKPIPEAIKKIMGKTLIQESTNGWHLFYKYEEDLPKTRIDEYKIDLENDGGQVVISPSLINGIKRKLTFNSIIKMPDELKKLIKSKVTIPQKTYSEGIREAIEKENFKINPKDLQLKNNGLEGCCNTEFTKLGGVIRKILPIKQTGQVLHILNKHLLEKPMSPKTINDMLRQLNKYVTMDESVLAKEIIDYLKHVEEANRTEIAMAVVGTNRGEDKKRVDKVLGYLVKEEVIVKNRANYSTVTKADWKTNLINIGIPIDFKMPYFDDIMNFNYGDLILIGSKNSAGKTHISMNIVKKLVKQNKNPYYVSLESGSRWSKIALQLGLKEGDFKWDEIADSNKIELENNAITIVDWLCPNNYAETDKLLKYFTEKLQKTKGIAIVFVQLRDNNEWLAKDLIKQFPAFACRYVYSDDETGEFGEYRIDKNRDAKYKGGLCPLPCRYDWNTKELKLIKELQKEEDENKS